MYKCVSSSLVLGKMWATLLALIALVPVGMSQREHVCEYGSCYPATGDLLIGREQRLMATSTCGLTQPERYCIVSHLEEDTKCFTCNSRKPFSTIRFRDSHRIENIVSSFRDRRRRWWQARNGEETVSVQLDLETEFHFTHLIMTFKTFRPKAMLVERSFDGGITWKVYRYFASDCDEIFPGVSTGPVKNLTDVICEARYSNVVPATRGEVIFRVLPPNVAISNPYQQDVQDLLKLTNLRINFTHLHTLGDDLLDQRPEIQEKYYYAMYDMTVRGSCSCYGHAARCTPLPGLPDRADMVHGKCECQHHTTGNNCQLCEPLYNDLPWRPARGRETHACKKCDCNEHAKSCKFDPALYKSSDFGGVCLDCDHNTMGIHCDECADFYYRDINRPMSDVYACRHCDCDPSGSLHNGRCEQRSDPERGMIAGACTCRKNVEGVRCDRCKDGFWNIRADNPDGCEACRCDTVGTIGNLGCDKISGVCRCKRYVTGRSCDQCYATFWGLSADLQDGCQPCNCDIGGSLTGECELTTGQCHCRENINGRSCEAPKMFYYFPNLNHNVYEAEYAKLHGNSLIQVREPLLRRRPTWSGPGFVKVSEGDSIEFKVDGIRLSMYYDIIIRYEPLMPERWDDIRVSIVRPETIDLNGACANIIPQDDLLPTSLQPGNRYVVLTPRTCLEKGGKYTIKVDFKKYKSDQRTPEATVLIDSIALTPNVDSVPIFQGPGEPERMKQEYTYYRCREYQFGLTRGEVPDVCKRYIFSISAVIHSKALECGCDKTGSVSNECNTLGGQCPCKNNIIARKCDQCSPGTYGFGPQGCTPCNCDPVGARDNHCNSESGQCMCIPNAYGRTCGECQAGFWRFPHCRPCDCNGNADTCDNVSGDCQGCRDDTAGRRCEGCNRGYYGDPRVSVRISCRECRCPGGIESGYNHADGCSLVLRTNLMMCSCQPAYTGNTCDSCIDNYFGNALVAGGKCQPCVCSNNIDMNVPGSCDPATGECLKCMFNTQGFNCEHCKDGYYGIAVKQGCLQCICDKLGTDPRTPHCDRGSGQCMCLPNVEGKICDRCMADHWNIASEKGCESCGCDAPGSTSSQCDQLGQCSCIPERGGRDCSQCRDKYWGDPLVHCTVCKCNPAGTLSEQCDRRTGQCPCKPGITGLRCDRCDRGTTGELPNCVPCGDCYDSWDREINDVGAEIQGVLERVNITKKEGGLEVFQGEFGEIERALEEVKEILSNTSYASANLAPLSGHLDLINANLTANKKNLEEIKKQLSNTTERMESYHTRVEKLQGEVTKLKEQATQLRDNATQVLIDDVGGAYNITLMAKRKSDAAKQKVDSTTDVIEKSEATRRKVDELIKTKTEQFNTEMKVIDDDMSDIDRNVKRLAENISDINKIVCDSKGEVCDDLCGGGGCGSCGGASCGKGAVTRADDALGLAKEAETLLKQKESDIEKLLVQVRESKQRSQMARDDAQMAYDAALKAKVQSEVTQSKLNVLLKDMSEFMSSDRATADDIQKVADDVLALKVSLTPAQIEVLSNRISDTLDNLQDVDKILLETKDNVTQAQLLEQRAKNASSEAGKSLGIAKNVLNALDGAKEAQDQADKAIRKAESDIDAANGDLQQIEQTTKGTLEKLGKLARDIKDMEERVGKIKNHFTNNGVVVKKAEGIVKEAEIQTSDLDQKSDMLEKNYKSMVARLDIKHNTTSDGKERAVKLKVRAMELGQRLQTGYERLTYLLQITQRNEKTIIDVQTEVDRLAGIMAKHLNSITKQAASYVCTNK